jgi:hypothetical protein
MSDGYQTVNGLTQPAATEQDKLIASVVLAGWRIIQKASIQSELEYEVRDPNGYVVGYRSTRYSAALLAERYLHEPALAELMPTGIK